MSLSPRSRAAQHARDTLPRPNQVTNTGYTYDGAGNLATTPSGGDTLTYNDAGQWTAATTTTGTEAFTYAGSSQDQVLSDGSAAGITYGLAGQDGQPWIQSYTPAGSATDYVLRDQQGDALGYVQGGADYAFATDNLGSVTSVTGTTVAGYTYDPYGHGNTPTGTGAAGNLIRYTGALQDTDSNYTHLGDRWYNPVTDNFTTQDANSLLASPANGNRYAYAADNPANNTDPTGKVTTPDDVCGLADGFIMGVAGAVLTVGLATAGLTLGTGLIAGLIGGAALAVMGMGIGYACNHTFSSTTAAF